MRKRTWMMLAFVGFFLTLPAGAGAADDLKPLVKKGEQALDAKDYQTALEAFQNLVGKLQKLLEATFETFMPEALPGWTAGEIKSQSWAHTTEGQTANMTNLTQEFTRKSDGKTITVNLSNWPHVVAPLKASLQMYKGREEMMNMDPNTKFSIEERGEWTIMRVVNIKRESTEIQAIGEYVMVSLSANYADAKEADHYLEAMDLAGVSRKSAPSR